MNELDFELIRPYNNAEVRAAIPRIIKDPTFHVMMDYLFQPDEKEEIISKFSTAKNIEEFQLSLTLPAVLSILKSTTTGITHSGLDNLNKDDGYVFLANHRDIVLDSSILGLKLLRGGFRTPQTAWGNNLMVSPLIVDLGKSNQMITVYREGSPKELLLNSQRLSTYIRESVTELNNLVWLAHRKGRAKDGYDRTDVSILKMLTLSGKSEIKEKLIQLNITPITISYEWEPCDAMKVKELYLSKGNNYIKADDEDFNSIIGGLTGEKGNVHLTIGKPINSEILEIDNQNINNNEFVGLVARLVDKQIHTNYKLWPSNYLAYDMLYETSKYSDQYSDDTKINLEKRYKQTAALTGHDNNNIRNLFLLLYANPVTNKLAALS